MQLPNKIEGKLIALSVAINYKTNKYLLAEYCFNVNKRHLYKEVRIVSFHIQFTSLFINSQYLKKNNYES